MSLFHRVYEQKRAWGAPDQEPPPLVEEAAPVEEAKVVAWRLAQAEQSARKAWGDAWSKLGPRQQAGEVALAALAFMAAQDDSLAPKMGEKFQSLATAILQRYQT